MQADSELEPPQLSTSAATTPTSATKRKFGYRQGLPLRERISAAERRRHPIETSFVRCSMLSALVKGLACRECSEPTLKIRAIDRRLGLVCLFETYCTTCGAVLNSTLSSDRIDEEKAGNVPFVVVRQAVAATMDMGLGHAGLVKLCRFMDMEPLQHKSYSRHVKAVTAANMTVVSSLFDDAANTVRQTYLDRDASITDDSILDLTVTFDGSWMKRGHNSLYGIGCVVDVETGLVLDLTVLSLYCQRCAIARSQCQGNRAKFAKWLESHTECNQNYRGTSGGMEVEAAEILWNRSMERGFRYTTMVSDGDSRSYNHLTNLRIYGDVELHKEECINHVAKRLGTALRKLAASGKKGGVTLGGRGFGRLTQATIIKLTAYYGMAVRAHTGNYHKMHDAVWASFDHATSTDKKPQHDRCPVGADSWCFYQKALATGQKPGPHRANVGTPLSPEVAIHVKDVYTRLADKSLLERCLKGKTQNPNESLHSKIWAKCPKTGFVGLQRVLSSTCAAVAEFNSRVEVTMRRLCDTMGIASGERLIASAKKADRKRLHEAERQAEASTKTMRQARMTTRAASAEASASDYAAGEF